MPQLLRETTAVKNIKFRGQAVGIVYMFCFFVYMVVVLH